jgi:uncharacterized protein (UPF0335 family)
MTQDQATPGHNSAPADTLLAYIERIERLEEEKKTIAFEITEVKREAKGLGLDVKAIVKIVKERGETEEQRRRRKETEDLTDVYRAALGMLDGTPLGDSARERLSKRRDPDAGAPAQVRRYGEQAARQVPGENACGNDNALCDEVA